MDLGRHATRQRKKKTRTPTTLTIESGTMMSFPLKTMTRVTSRSFIDERQKEIKKPGDGIQNALLDGEENEIEDKTIMTRVRSRSHSAEREGNEDTKRHPSRQDERERKQYESEGNDADPPHRN